ncbi:hypothetical protein GCM10011316_22810 [Roseibium aquae]|uniref:SnoaL-like domain-containing protein n=1 Tax=Roseibium aquae TaxID=1323746 RepID=A0A916TJW0_9HYPH|nr:nuclear transport factor 2 family protein [Roseibium aquae]GGB50146.1 hypothetical protein GCM10011316_22810 [Roseibium aquae]
MIPKQDAAEWLRAYGQAWIDGDPTAVAALFGSAAAYHETPFDPPLKGTAAIRSYWQAGAAEAQADVTFESEIWSLSGSVVIAGWRAAFTRIPSGARVDLDGVFRLVLKEDNGTVLCTELREWWHRKEHPRLQPFHETA